jgi:nitrous oxide reductase accessory protein NosL
MTWELKEMMTFELRNAPQPPLNRRGGEGELCEFRRFFVCFLTALAFIIASILSVPAYAGQKEAIKPAKGDKCQVCGMFVAKYPDFAAEVIFHDGSYAVFDGAKDMFTSYFNLGKYNPKKKLSDVATVYVTDYYDLNLIDALKAFYVIGSDVYGPMGRELIPFAKRSDAEGFMKDHRAKTILTFQEVTLEKVKGLD